jgi:hypothetical protein
MGKTGWITSSMPRAGRIAKLETIHAQKPAFIRRIRLAGL